MRFSQEELDQTPKGLHKQECILILLHLNYKVFICNMHLILYGYFGAKTYMRHTSNIMSAGEGDLVDYKCVINVQRNRPVFNFQKDLTHFCMFLSKIPY